MYRLTCLIKQYEKYQRKLTSEFEAEMSKIFDITKSDGEWLCKEDKKLYENQVKSNGQRWSPRGRPWPRGRPRGHILKSLALASKPQVLGLGLEALGPRKLPCPRLEDQHYF